MCNPRRVRVTATRNLAESWKQEVRRQVNRSGQATGAARVREPLSATLGTPTLAALASVLARTPGWERSGDAFVHQLDGGYVRYDAARRELEIVAVATGTVEVSLDGSVVVEGSLDTSIQVEGVGIYYGDGYGGTSPATARAAARHDAAAALDAEAKQQRTEARRETDERAGAAVLRDVTERAETAFDEATAEREEQLREQAAAELTAVGIEGRNVFHQALAAAYRDAILAYARSRGAEGIRCAEQGGTVDIEFELVVG
jgi:hypothetical protein